MKKKKTANLIMVAIIAVIAVGGVLAAGHIRGWFGGKAGSAKLTDITGIVTLEREGVSFNVREDTELRQGDKISCAPAATAKISAGEGSIVLGEEAVITVEEPSEKAFRASMSAGEAFAEAKDAPVEISFENGETTLKNAVAAFSVRTGAQSVSVYYGEVEGAKAGEVKEWVGSQTYIHELDINSLNDFNIARIRMAGDSSGLYFAKADVDALEARRQAEIEEARRQAQEEEARKTAEEAARKQAEQKAAEEAERKAAEAAAKAKAEAEKKAAEEAARKAEEERKAAEEAAAQAKSEEERKAAEEAARKAEEERLAAEEAARKAEEERLAAEEAARKAEEERLAAEEAARIAEEERLAAEEAAKLYCYITIRCDTILDNWDDLDPEKAPYVPANGVILGKTKMEFQEGETVFDVLKRICTERGIQIEYSYTPMFGNYYIEGIHHLYEFDCGPESGWMYKVNGWFPNYGCSDYNLQKDDNIVWCYTCKGLGADVGGSVN